MSHVSLSYCWLRYILYYILVLIGLPDLIYYVILIGLPDGRFTWLTRFSIHDDKSLTYKIKNKHMFREIYEYNNKHNAYTLITSIFFFKVHNVYTSFLSYFIMTIEAGIEIVQLMVLQL